MQRYALITEYDVYAEDGTLQTPANTVVNIILWDGVADYMPEAGYVLAASDTLAIGESAMSAERTP